MYYGSYLSHHGIEGQKWGVRNGPPYPLSRGVIGSAYKKKNVQKQNREDGPKISKETYEGGTKTKIEYDSKKNTMKKQELDEIAERLDYSTAKSKFDSIMSDYDNNMQNGEDYANKLLHDRLKDYSYKFVKYDEMIDGNQYISYCLGVYGNKMMYYTYEEDGYLYVTFERHNS